MIDKKEAKTKRAIELLEKRNHLVEQYANGHIKVNGWEFWCTSEKFYHSKTNTRGQGFKNFIEALESM